MDSVAAYVQIYLLRHFLKLKWCDHPIFYTLSHKYAYVNKEKENVYGENYNEVVCAAP